MVFLIATVELIEKGNRYMDEKGWSFKVALEELGHKVELFYYKKRGAMSFLEKNKGIKALWHYHMNKSLIRRVRELKPDILVVGKGDTIEAETLWEIRKKIPIILVNVFPDNPLYMMKFENVVPYHLFFVKDSYVVETLHKAGLKNVHYLPQCTDPSVHKPMVVTEKDMKYYGCDVSLLGSMYPYRVKLVERLVKYNFYIWGKGWDKLSISSQLRKCYRGKDTRGTKKAKIINATAISLNPHHPLNDIRGVNRRTYDIAACRGFQLSDYKDDLEKLFKVGEEVICFRNGEELERLIEYYLAHPDERKDIAEKAYKRVRREHTYKKRAEEILSIVERCHI